MEVVHTITSKAEAQLRASYGLAAIPADRLRAHIEAAADEFLRAHALA